MGGLVPNRIFMLVKVLKAFTVLFGQLESLQVEDFPGPHQLFPVRHAIVCKPTSPRMIAIAAWLSPCAID